VTRRLRRLAVPNDDLAVDRNGRVYKLKGVAWLRLNEHFPVDAVILYGAGRYETREVAA
jgi:hypothetical protein